MAEDSEDDAPPEYDSSDDFKPITEEEQIEKSKLEKKHRLTLAISTNKEIKDVKDLSGWGDFREKPSFKGIDDENYIKKVPNCVTLGNMTAMDALALSTAKLPFYVFCLFTDSIVDSILMVLISHPDLERIYFVNEFKTTLDGTFYKDHEKITLVDHTDFSRLLRVSPGRIFLCGHGNTGYSGNPPKHALTISSTTSSHNLLLLHDLFPSFPPNSDVIIGMCYSGLIAEVVKYRLVIPDNVIVSFVSTTSKSHDAEALALVIDDTEFRKKYFPTGKGGRRFNRKHVRKRSKRKTKHKKNTKRKRSRRMLK